MKLKIYDDDGFIAIVNNTNYHGFVDEDWELDQLMAHFINQMNVGNISIWQTSNNGGGAWTVSFQTQLFAAPAFRQFDQFINVTSGELFLTNYADLTMVAQFNDQSIPTRHNADLKIKLENGWYRLTVRQMFDPDSYEEQDEIEANESPAFEIAIVPSTPHLSQTIDKVHWFEI